jgi:hypothetical protein
MPTNFPTSVDNFTNPTANDSLNLPSHSTQHANANDAIEAIEGYLLNGGQGLTLIKKQTIGSAVSSVTVTGAFSATYDNYKIIINGGSSSVDQNIVLEVGTATTGYYAAFANISYASGAVTGINNNNASSFNFAGYCTASTIGMSAELFNPFLTKNTLFNSIRMPSATGAGAAFYSGFLNDSNSYTSFKIYPGGGTLTGGTIYVYGYGLGQ